MNKLPEIREYDIALCLLQLDVMSMGPTRKNAPVMVVLK